MHYLFIVLLLMTSMSWARSISFDKKSGAVYAVGVTGTNYDFPLRFTGSSKKKVDDSSTLIGPVLSLGYDILPGSIFLVGIRGEAYFADTLNMGNKNDDKVSDSTRGKMSGLNLTGRFGIPLKIKMMDAVEQETHMTGEFFLEGGVGKLWASMTKDYKKKEGQTEEYNETIYDNRMTGILAAGFVFATESGNFIELKAMQTRTISNKIDFEGSQRVSGGSEVKLKSLQKKDTNQGAITAVVLSFGHHW